jgi:hypothetical protein
VAAVSVSGPVTRLSLGQVATLADAVIHAARSISASMGFYASDAAPAARSAVGKNQSVRT